MKRLFQIADKGGKSVAVLYATDESEYYFEKKEDAKEVRNKLNSKKLKSKKFHKPFKVVPGPDHWRHK